MGEWCEPYPAGIDPAELLADGPVTIHHTPTDQETLDVAGRCGPGGRETGAMNDAPSLSVIPRWDRRAVIGMALLWGSALLLIAHRWIGQWWPAWFAFPRFGCWAVLAIAVIAIPAADVRVAERM